MHSGLHVRKTHQHAHAVLAQIRAACRHPFLTAAAVQLQMWRAVVKGAFVVPALAVEAVRISGQLRIQFRIEAQQQPLVRRRDFLDQHARLVGVTHARKTADLLHHRAPHLEAHDVELPVRRIHHRIQRGEIEVPIKAHYCRLRFFKVSVHQHAEKLRPVVADVDEFAIHRPHLRIQQPRLRHPARIHRMRQPRQRLRDRLRILLLRRNRRQMPVEVMIRNDVQRRGRHIVALLIARRHQPCLLIHPDERLAQAIPNHLHRPPIRRNLDHRPVVLAIGRPFLAPLRNI